MGAATNVAQPAAKGQGLLAGYSGQREKTPDGSFSKKIIKLNLALELALDRAVARDKLCLELGPILLGVLRESTGDQVDGVVGADAPFRRVSHTLRRQA